MPNDPARWTLLRRGPPHVGAQRRVAHHRLDAGDPAVLDLEQLIKLQGARQAMGFRGDADRAAGGTAGIEALEQMLGEDAQRLAGRRYSRGPGRAGQRWGATRGKIGFHGGKIEVGTSTDPLARIGGYLCETIPAADYQRLAAGDQWRQRFPWIADDWYVDLTSA